MIEVIFKIFLTDYIDFQGFITKRIQKPLLIEYNCSITSVIPTLANAMLWAIFYFWYFFSINLNK
jgi:hypothetical protein